jgi:hypothetical protein
MAVFMHISEVEKRANEVVYWIREHGKPECDFGFIFKGTGTGIARQEIVESFLLAMTVMGEQMKKEGLIDGGDE